MMALGLLAALGIVFFFCTHPTSGSYPTAQNVTWKSNNFKTFLTWEPKPSANYSYTVEYSALGMDRQRNLLCIRSSGTWCDLSDSLTDLKACYTADVLSEPPLGASSEIIEFPYTSAPKFCPYKDTNIGKPEFKLEVSEDKRMTTLYVTDPPTALYKDGRHLNIRDIFSKDLEYKVTYRKNKSTGKKVLTSNSSVIEVKNLDRGESYCFNVQVYIPSRSPDKQLGELSLTQCSPDDPTIVTTYSVGVIAAAIFLILLLIGIVIAVIVVCCKHRNKALKNEKEGVPLRDKV
ncbi:Tissue factor [Channa argus]|uniref:Tissue factor n=1 Tax=Channa argus TaxID=215402 RepID=A0A6G1QMA8_CHAAH|nr:Tissue factor [Channa argus]